MRTPDGNAIRPTIDALAEVSGDAQADLEGVAGIAEDGVERIARLVGSARSAVGRNGPDGDVHAVGAHLRRIIDQAQRDIAHLFAASTRELDALRRPVSVTTELHDEPRAKQHDVADAAPPLPPLDDIVAIKGSKEWAAEVVKRYPRLTVDEVLAIFHYTTVDGVAEMNSHLRFPDATPKAERPRIDKLIADATSGLAKLPGHSGITFRGTNMPVKVESNWQAGARIADPAFYSSSIDAGIADQFRAGGNSFITIIGHSGVDVQSLSYFGNEAEILFKPGTELRVLSRRWDDELSCWKFRVEEISK